MSPDYAEQREALADLSVAYMSARDFTRRVLCTAFGDVALRSVPPPSECVWPPDITQAEADSRLRAVQHFLSQAKNDFEAVLCKIEAAQVRLVASGFDVPRSWIITDPLDTIRGGYLGACGVEEIVRSAASEDSALETVVKEISQDVRILKGEIAKTDHASGYGAGGDATPPPHDRAEERASRTSDTYSYENEVAAAIRLYDMLVDYHDDSDLQPPILENDNRHKTITTYRSARQTGHLPSGDSKCMRYLLDLSRLEDLNERRASQDVAGEWADLLYERYSEIREQYPEDAKVRHFGFQQSSRKAGPSRDQTSTVSESTTPASVGDVPAEDGEGTRQDALTKHAKRAGDSSDGGGEDAFQEAMQRLAACKGDMEVAKIASDESKSVDQRLRDICNGRQEYWFCTSVDFAKMLGCSDGAVRQTDFWQINLPELREMEKEHAAGAKPEQENDIRQKTD